MDQSWRQAPAMLTQLDQAAAACRNSLRYGLKEIRRPHARAAVCVCDMGDNSLVGDALPNRALSPDKSLQLSVCAAHYRLISITLNSVFFSFVLYGRENVQNRCFHLTLSHTFIQSLTSLSDFFSAWFSGSWACWTGKHSRTFSFCLRFNCVLFTGLNVLGDQTLNVLEQFLGAEQQC